MKHRSSYWSMVFLWLALILVSGLMPHWVSGAQAQDVPLLAYGTNAQGAISAEMPLMMFSFSGNAGDLVQVDVMSLSGGLDPSVDLIAPDQQTIAAGYYNRLGIAHTDAHISLFLPQTGVYSLMVRALHDSSGQFLLELNGRNPVNAAPLVSGVPVDVVVPQNAPPQYFSFEALDCPTHLIVASPSAGMFPYVVKVRDPQGQTVARLRGDDTFEDRVIVEPLSGNYEVEVWSSDPMIAGNLTLLVTCGDGEPACPGADSTAGEPGTECPTCPPCPGETGEIPGLCDTFQVVVEDSEDGIVVLSWPAQAGADHYTVTGTNLTTGEFVYGRHRLDFELYDVIELARWGGFPGDRYEFAVTAVTLDGILLCTDTIVVDYTSGPVRWGPGVSCDIRLLEPLGVMANGPQAFAWTTVTDGETYMLSVSSADGTLTANRFDSSLSHTSFDVSEAAIGGTSPFLVEIEVFNAAGHYMCSDSTTVTRQP